MASWGGDLNGYFRKFRGADGISAAGNGIFTRT